MYDKIIVGFDDRAEGMDALHLAARLPVDWSGAVRRLGLSTPGIRSQTPTRARSRRTPSSYSSGRARPRPDWSWRPGRCSGPRRRRRFTSWPRRRTPISSCSAPAIAGSWAGSSPAAPRAGSCTALHARSRLRLADTPSAPIAGLRQIAVGYDGEAESRVALRAAEGLAEARGRCYGCWRLPSRRRLDPATRSPSPTLPGELQERLNEGVAKVSRGIDAAGEMLRGEAGPALVAWAAESDVDLIVVGSRGYGPVARVLLGSVAAKLMREAPCPVLVVPRPAGVEDLAAASAGGPAREAVG